MAEIVVIGGGIAGLLAAKALKDTGFSVVGLEGSSSLGGRVGVGHHRLRSENAKETVRALCEGLQLDEIQEPPLIRSKGEWEGVKEDHSFIEAERFYLSQHYWVPAGGYLPLISRLTEELGENFQTRKLVSEVHPEQKKVLCEDGVEHSYQKLVWCSPLLTLRNAWKGDRSQLSAISKLPEGRGGISLEMDLREPLFSSKNTVILPFRFKEWRLNALGFANSSGSSNIQWLLFLEDEILEDREEVAKCVKTLKREISKEFPNAAELSSKEKLTYLQVISGETPLEWKSILITPDIAYFGPESRLAGTDESWRNLDLTLANYALLKKELGSWKNLLLE